MCHHFVSDLVALPIDEEIEHLIGRIEMASEYLYLAANGLNSVQVMGSWVYAGLQDHFGEVADDATCLFVAFHQFKLYSLFTCVEIS